MHFLKNFLLFSILSLLNTTVTSQTCATLGQTPSTAFPVCGTTVFKQDIVPLCVNNQVSVLACNDGVPYSDKNPFWYQFTCYSSGTLGFLITPNNLDDDYDWQLFDITGRNPDDVFVDPSLAVTGNWSGNSSLQSARGYTGVTGASTDGKDIFICATNPIELGQAPPYSDASTFCKMPNIVEGRTYLLLVSHYTDSQSGYELSFAGGTASITDPKDPGMRTVEASCDRSQLRLKLNKKMKCTTLAADGSDFTILDQSFKFLSATSATCTDGFDMDSVILTLDGQLPPGDYFLAVKKGNDNNTLLDNCDREIPAGSSMKFIIYGRQPTSLDSIIPPPCAPDVLQLAFKKSIKCNSIAKDGSDFKISGPFPVKVSGAEGSCTVELSKIINIHLAAPIVHEGTYTVTLLNGFDGNTVIDECGEETPDSMSISFTVKDTVSANFTYHLKAGCQSDTIAYFNKGGNDIVSWNWTFDNGITSTQQNPEVVYTNFGNKTAQCIVTNGFCTDTSTVQFYLDHDSLRADFSGPSVYCPDDIAIFKDSSMGNIISWQWEFGNGYTSSEQNPLPQTYRPVDRDRLFPIRLVIESDKNCYDTIVHYIKVVNNCYIAVPSAFTPNRDGKNDYLYPLNAYKAINLQFRVFNKYGQQVFETQDWTRKWDGKLNGLDQPSGVYVWMLQYTDIDTNKKIFFKGTTVLIR